MEKNQKNLNEIVKEFNNILYIKSDVKLLLFGMIGQTLLLQMNVTNHKNISEFIGNILPNVNPDKVTFQLSKENDSLYLSINIKGDEKYKCDILKLMINEINMSVGEVNDKVMFGFDLFEYLHHSETAENKINFTYNFSNDESLNNLKLYKSFQNDTRKKISTITSEILFAKNYSLVKIPTGNFYGNDLNFNQLHELINEKLKIYRAADSIKQKVK